MPGDSGPTAAAPAAPAATPMNARRFIPVPIVRSSLGSISASGPVPPSTTGHASHGESLPPQPSADAAGKPACATGLPGAFADELAAQVEDAIAAREVDQLVAGAGLLDQELLVGQRVDPRTDGLGEVDRERADQRGLVGLGVLPDRR